MLGRKIGGEWEPALVEEERCKPGDHSDARFDPVSHLYAPCMDTYTNTTSGEVYIGKVIEITQQSNFRTFKQRNMVMRR